MEKENKPTRQKPFENSAFLSGKERELLLDCLESRNWSSFKGATEGWDIREVTMMSSTRANDYGPLENRFLGGKYIRQLEANVAKKFNVRFCVSSNSATSCLVMAIGSLNLGHGDEVIVPSMSFNATATAILAYNAIPVFCEVKADTFCMDPVDLEKKISAATKAILVVHLGGNGADLDAIMMIAKKYNLYVIEDCAQAPGVTYNDKHLGTFGDVGIFSLTETKNISCGEARLLVTDNTDIAMKSRLIRNHGEGVVEDNWSDEELVNIIGMNYRLTELQGAIAIPQLDSLDERNEIRRKLTNYLLSGLKKYDSILVPPTIEKNVDYCCYMLKWKWQPKKGMISRDELVKRLQNEGIPVSKGYGRMMHENPIFTRKTAYTKSFPFLFEGKALTKARYGTGTLPVSERINNQFVWFKYINPPNTISDMDDVIEAFNKILND